MALTKYPNDDLTAARLEALERRVAELEEANAALRRENDALIQDALFLDSIVENLPSMVFVKRAEELRFVLFNRAGEELLGRRRAEMIGKNDYDFFPREQADFFTAKDREVLDSGELLDIQEEPINTPHMGTRLLHTRKLPIRDERGEAAYLLGISEDITEHKRALESLADATAQLSTLLEHFPGAVWTCDEELRLTSSGGAHAAALGFGRPEAMGARMTDGNCFTDEIQRVYLDALDGKIGGHEITSGGRTYEVVVRPLERHGQRGALAIALDATERRRLEAERFEAKLQDAQKHESLGVLAANIAHDFNNLLVGVMGHAGLAALQLPEDAPARQSVQRIERIAERAAELTRQMLAYSGRSHFVIEAVDLSRVVQDIAELLKVSISKGATLHLRCAADLPLVEVDVAQIRQVVMNLITNASDALEGRGGQIVLSTGYLDATSEDLASDLLDEPLPPGPYVWLEVGDTGVGMSPETRAHIFDPFFTTKPGGHGLGLAATPGIIRGHLGALQVRSTPGQGTRIRVLFPAREGEPTQEVHSALVAGESRGGVILVVDDEEEVRALAAAVLEYGGYEVVEAASGEAALALLQEDPQRFDLALVDLTMPGQGGAETFRAARQLRPDLPILLSSGYAEHDALTRVADQARADFLQKPYAIRELLEKVAILLCSAEEDLGDL